MHVPLLARLFSFLHKILKTGPERNGPLMRVPLIQATFRVLQKAILESSRILMKPFGCVNVFLVFARMMSSSTSPLTRTISEKILRGARCAQCRREITHLLHPPLLYSAL